MLFVVVELSENTFPCQKTKQKTLIKYNEVGNNTEKYVVALRLCWIDATYSQKQNVAIKTIDRSTWHLEPRIEVVKKRHTRLTTAH